MRYVKNRLKSRIFTVWEQENVRLVLFPRTAVFPREDAAREDAFLEIGDDLQILYVKFGTQ